MSAKMLSPEEAMVLYKNVRRAPKVEINKFYAGIKNINERELTKAVFQIARSASQLEFIALVTEGKLPQLRMPTDQAKLLTNNTDYSYQGPLSHAYKWVDNNIGEWLKESLAA
ncbi:MAG: hypothetical protein SGI74_13500 [Oligoflexia bacterium]|nr:hypothetical protein [Oligoflexia bacterium]